MSFIDRPIASAIFATALGVLGGVLLAHMLVRFA